MSVSSAVIALKQGLELFFVVVAAIKLFSENLKSQPHGDLVVFCYGD